MEMNFYHPSIFLLSNETSFDNLHLSNESSFHLFILIILWIVLLFTIIFGTIGNILVLYVYINRDDNKTCTFFIKILATIDLVICLLLAPLELYQTTTGIHNEILCKFYGFLSTHVLYSTLLITIIAFDRYFCICWPLYKIITINRARTIVIICGIFSSLLAIIPMNEYSTMEHILQLHDNHSEQLSLQTSDEYQSPIYTHIENLKTDLLTLPFTLGNITKVKCSPRFSLQFQLSNFLVIYRFFHSTLFAVCIVLVVILYSFIYNAVYQRRRTRTKKFSTYRRILHSYLINDLTNRQSSEQNSFLTDIFCYCCHIFHRHTFNETSRHRTYSNQDQMTYFHDESSCVIKQKPRQVVLEVNGARGKRYSSISMTSMTYLTSGVWDETAPNNITRSRINSTTAMSYCGTEHSLTNRPSTSTDDSIDQTYKLLTLNQKSIHLTVPNHSNDISINERESQTFHRSIVRKPSQTLSNRQQRPSDLSMQQRKVSFMTNAGLAEQCIIEDPSSHNQQFDTNITPNDQSTNRHSLSRLSSTIESNNSLLRESISSTRRSSGFDIEAQRIFERQQRQERLANIRTTLTLFIVTATFILMYLPSIIIILFNVKPHEFREIFFLLYYINSACNPLIYSFFNINFRNDIRRIYEYQKRECFARRY